MGDSVAAIDLATRTLANAAFVSRGLAYYDGGYDLTTDELYLGQQSFSGASRVDIFDGTTGAFKRSFLAGIAPAHFAFYR